MSGIGAKWVVQRYEPALFGDITTERSSLWTAGYEKVCEDWREACEAVTLAIGPNCLKFGVEADQPVVFERDNAVIVVYLKLVC